jgi:hypothetical protein
MFASYYIEPFTNNFAAACFESLAATDVGRGVVGNVHSALENGIFS